MNSQRETREVRGDVCLITRLFAYDEGEEREGKEEEERSTAATGPANERERERGRVAR